MFAMLVHTVYSCFEKCVHAKRKTAKPTTDVPQHEFILRLLSKFSGNQKADNRFAFSALYYLNNSWMGFTL